MLAIVVREGKSSGYHALAAHLIAVGCATQLAPSKCSGSRTTVPLNAMQELISAAQTAANERYAMGQDDTRPVLRQFQ